MFTQYVDPKDKKAFYEKKQKEILEDLAEKIFLGVAIKNSSDLLKELEKLSYEYRKGKEFADLKKAIDKGVKQGRGKFEHEVSWIALYLKDVFKPKTFTIAESLKKSAEEIVQLDKIGSYMLSSVILLKYKLMIKLEVIESDLLAQITKIKEDSSLSKEDKVTTLAKLLKNYTTRIK